MPTEKPPERSLHRKLAQVMYEAERIPKNGTAPAAMGGFKFVQVGDAADSIRKALAEKSVSMIPTAIELVSETEHQTAGGKAMTTMTVRTTWTLTDGDSGESTVIQSIGSGADMGDKAAPKAQSSAMKYALLMGFLLSTGDDPEQTDTSDRRPRNVQRPVGAYDEPPDRPELERTTHEDGLSGTANLGKNGGGTTGTDFLLREEATRGHVLGFRLTQGRKGYKVLAFDPLASVLATQNIIGERVTCWGTMQDETFKDEKSGYDVTYQVMHLERIATPDIILPAPVTDSGLPEAPNADAIAEIMGELDAHEAESAPLFELDEDERAAVAGTLK